jgi:hypothetical protein
VAASPTRPFVAADLRTLVLSGSSLADDISLRNPALMRRFLLRITHGVPFEFQVGSATYDAVTDELRVTVSGGIMPLAGFTPGDAIEIRPRFFRVITGGVQNSLPASSQVLVEFQGALENAQGNPDVLNVSPWVTSISMIDPNAGANPNYRFFRFRISFDISAQGAPLSFNTPIPTLDFFRIRFRF